MKFACALKSNGLTRYVSNLNQCKSTEIKITIHDGSTYSLCVNPDGSVRDIPPRQCKKPGRVLTIPPTTGTVYFCANNSTGVLRDNITDPSQCTATEFPVFVIPNNRPPVAVADSYSTDEDTPLTVPAPGVLANDSDPDGDPITAVLVSGPSHSASFALNANGSFSYTPASDYNGSDNFTYRDTDNHGATGNTVSVSLTVNAVNDAPVNNLPAAQSVNQDSSLVLSSENGNQLSVSDVDAGSGPGFEVQLSVSHGTLTLSQTTGLTVTGNGTASVDLTGTLADANAALNGMTYTPTSGYFGPDTLAITSNDHGATGSGGAKSDSDNLSITVNHVNHAPFATADSYSTNEDTPLTVSAPGVLVNDTDLDGDTLHAVLVSGPSHAAPSGFTLNADGSFSYTPAANYNGSDSFQYKANDGTADSNTVTVSLTINPVNDAPVANDDSASTDEDTPLNGSSVLGNDTDVENDPLTAVLVSGPSHAASFNLNSDGTYSYTPDADFNGTDSFTYKANDGTLDSNVATVMITVNAVNDAPVNTLPPGPVSAHQGGDTPISGISVTDVDAGSDDIQTTLSVAQGTVTVSTSVLGGVGVLGVTGNGTATAVVTASQSEINTTLADANGLTYHPNAGYSGPDTLTVTTDDLGHTGSGGAMSDTDTLAIEVPANSAPTDIQLSDSSIAENQPSGTDVGTLTTTDPDVGDTHTYTLENAGCGGGPFPDNGSFQIGGVSNDKLQSSASFDFETKNSYTVCVRSTDSGSLSFDKQFTISINDINDVPTDISLSNNSIDENQPSGTTIGSLTATDQDAGQTHTFSFSTSCVGGPFENASFSISGNTLKSGVSFNYEVKKTFTICVRTTDSGSPALSFDKQFTININDVNDAPVANPDSYSGAIGNTVAVVQTTATGPHVTLSGNSLIANDTDEDQTFPHTLSAVAETVSSTGGGSVQINSDGSFVYTPGVGDKNQDDTFTYHVTDGSLTSAGTATIHIDNFLVWYVDNSSAAATHDGRSNSPLLGLSGLNGAGGSGDSDGPGDYIFVYYGTGASYGGGIPLEANQSLWGEKQGLTVNGHNLVAAGANSPTITNASGTGVGLANGSDAEGLNISGTSGDAINGSAVTTSTVGTTTAVNISNAGGNGVALSGAASGNISIAAPIADSAGLNISVAGRSGGTVAFSGAISDSIAGTGGGISLTGNTGGTINLTGGVTASTTTNNAFSATGGGTVNVTGANNTLTTTTGTALNVASTTIGASGLTFKKIDSNGGSNTGIILDTTGSSGGLSVTGSGTAGSGGTIANKTGSDGSNTTGVGIYLNSTASPSFARMQLNDFQNFAIRGTTVAGFTLSDSTISGTNGTSTAADEASLAIDNLTGTASITNDNITGGFEDDARIKNTTGSLTSLSITGSTFATANLSSANDALSLIGQTGVAVFNASVTGNTFTRAQGDLYQYTLNTGTGTMHFDSNTVTNDYSATATLPAGGGDINISSGSLGNSPSLTYTASNNNIYSAGTGGQPPNGSVIVAAATPQGSATGTIANNLIGTTGVTQSAGFDAILVDAVKLGVHKVTITGNTIRRYKEAGIRILGVSPAASPGFNMRATVKSNVITEPDSVAFAGIDAEVGADPSDIGTMCVDLGGSGVDANSVSNGDPSNFNDINLIQQFATSMILPGYLGTATNDAAVEAFEQGRNNGDGTPTVFASHDTTTADGNPAGSGFLGGASCS